MGAESYVTNNVFTVRISGIELSFSKISGIGSSVEYDTYTEGGGMMHIFAKPKTAAGTVVFEKGISMVDKSSAVILAPGTAVRDVTIDLVKHRKVVKSYYIANGMVASWELGDLDAMSSAVAVNKITIAHTGIR